MYFNYYSPSISSIAFYLFSLRLLSFNIKIFFVSTCSSNISQPVGWEWSVIKYNCRHVPKDTSLASTHMLKFNSKRIFEDDPSAWKQTIPFHAWRCSQKALRRTRIPWSWRCRWVWRWPEARNTPYLMRISCFTEPLELML